MLMFDFQQFFFLFCYGDPRDLHSFPTRRSSDLQQKESTARVASIMENTNLSKQQQVSEIMLGKIRSEERFSRNAETELVCRLLLQKKTMNWSKPTMSTASLILLPY